MLKKHNAFRKHSLRLRTLVVAVSLTVISVVPSAGTTHAVAATCTPATGSHQPDFLPSAHPMTITADSLTADSLGTDQNVTINLAGYDSAGACLSKTMNHYTFVSLTGVTNLHLSTTDGAGAYTLSLASASSSMQLGAQGVTTDFWGNITQVCVPWLHLIIITCSSNPPPNDAGLVDAASSFFNVSSTVKDFQATVYAIRSYATGTTPPPDPVQIPAATLTVTSP
ncbi:hypothetical protein GCM10009838_29720 [Catenulispora subtropica]|uniref:Secreted protein n=1 Tax=Catenulispora subtropica TaxID=450798 RepID=A0ABP5CUL5_9ACTN